MDTILKNEILDALKEEHPEIPEIYEPEEGEQPNMIDENLLICEMSRAIQALGITTVEFTFREDDSESWTQVEYYSEKLQKVVIICYEAEEMFRDLDDLATALADYQEKADKLESSIFIINDEILQRISEMKENDSRTGEHQDASESDYLEWALEEYHANK